MIEDAQVLQAIEKMKAYSAYKGRQMKSPQGGGPTADADLRTIEMWANDPNDSGAAWGEKKQAESRENAKQSEKWNDVVRKDKQQADADADFRSKLDLKKVKEEIKDSLAKYVKALQSLGQAGEPGFEAKGAAASNDAKSAEKYVDGNLEKTLKENAEKEAASRRRNQRVADEANAKNEESKKWQSEYGNNPDKMGAGQRADVERALDNVAQLAEQRVAEIEPFGPKAANAVAGLNKVQDWAKKLKPKVATKPPGAAAVKNEAKAGVVDARAAFKSADQFQSGVETDANGSMDLFQRWTAQNNARAKEWINSSSAPHKAWAEAWMKSKG
ncbi:MAG: hypothetical protein ACKVS9_15975 [Phycisphaerae bacterium]